MSNETLSARNVHLIVEVTALEGKHLELGDQLKSLARASRSDDGVLGYDVVQDATDEKTFRFIECWRDSTALAAHHATQHVASFVESAPPCSRNPTQQRWVAFCKSDIDHRRNAVVGNYITANRNRSRLAIEGAYSGSGR
jgi:quinol monooxygenase YgiN